MPIPRLLIADWLNARLGEGGFTIGQVHVLPGIVVRHVDDVTALEILTRPQDAREIAKYDDAGNYRPLKTAPNLRHGWELRLESVADLRLALDLLYPAALGAWRAFERGELAAIDLRDTLARQTGLYRVTRLLTDAQAKEVIHKRCNPETGCIRRQLWRISADVPSPFSNPKWDPRTPKSEIPILCAEGCNLLVADCRPVAKQNLPESD